MGWALQQQKNLDGAANAYSIVVVAYRGDGPGGEGNCKSACAEWSKSRYLDAANAFLVIPSTYDYPELRAAAYCSKRARRTSG